VNLVFKIIEKNNTYQVLLCGDERVLLKTDWYTRRRTLLNTIKRIKELSPTAEVEEVRE